MLGKILLVVASVVGGIYLTSDEGKNARVAILKRKSAIEPIIKDLLKQANKVLEGSEKVSAEDVRANINKLVREAQSIISSIDFDAALGEIRKAISVSSRKIRLAMDEVDKSPQSPAPHQLSRGAARPASKSVKKMPVSSKAWGK